MRRLGFAIAVLVLVATSTGLTGQGVRRISELLTGYEEVPSVSTAGHGEFNARISNDQTQIEWELSYADLQAGATQAHIHFGQFNVNGGIVVFLCTNLGNGPAGTQACPVTSGTVSGTFTAVDMVTTAAPQGLSAGEFDELIRAMRAGKTYVNVHSGMFPGGELRSQINMGGRGAGAHNH